MRRTAAVFAALTVALGAGACQESGDDGITIDATGSVAGLAWVDRNGNGVLEGTDGPVAGVRVELRAPGGTQALYTGETGATGEFLLEDVLVGDYVARVDDASVGDSLRVLRVDSASLTVTPEETAAVVVGLTYPAITTDSARVAPLDSRLFIEGRIISEWGTFGEGTVHVRDSTGALRAVRVVATGTQVGDSVRLLGFAATQFGQPVLRDAVVFLLQTSLESPDPLPVSTRAAAAAEGGALDAELVRVTGSVQDTTRNAFGEPVIRVDDGSGLLDVVLDRDVPFIPLSIPPGSEVIGTVVEAAGVLVPPADGGGTRWVLKPRGNADIRVIAP